MTRLFITEARKNLTAETIPGNLPALHTQEELIHLEGKLREHEAWLAPLVEKQKGIKPWEDPVLLTEEMKTKAKALEKELLKLMRRKTPAKRKGNSSSSSASSSASESVTATAQDSRETPAEPRSDENLEGAGRGDEKIHDEL